MSNIDDESDLSFLNVSMYNLDDMSPIPRTPNSSRSSVRSKSMLSQMQPSSNDDDSSDEMLNVSSDQKRKLNTSNEDDDDYKSVGSGPKNEDNSVPIFPAVYYCIVLTLKLLNYLLSG